MMKNFFQNRKNVHTKQIEIFVEKSGAYISMFVRFSLGKLINHHRIHLEQILF